MTEFPNGVGERPGQGGQPQSTAQQARSAAGEVAETAKGQTQAVTGEARQQARQVVDQLRDRVSEQTQQQSRRAAQGIRQWADDLASMSEGGKPDSPVSGVVQQVADGGRRAADYLEQHGLTGVVEEVQNFARRRPGAFLAGALAAGFLVGRLAKASGGATSGSSTGGTGPYGGTTPRIPAQPRSGLYETPTTDPYGTPPAEPYGTDPYGTPPAEPYGTGPYGTTYGTPADPYRTPAETYPEQPATPQERYGGTSGSSPRNPGGDLR
ncbi:hypothetical protein GCM10010517_59090 [Streptosporangium fragile]|uniref:DUF3618 domain-containing protein n=1 Tax=Streptosporangium fragile TaxID=46186 RepID=A0ABN3W5D9_9ACTN